MINERTNTEYSFISLICLSFVIVFRSASVPEAARTVVLAGIVLLLRLAFLKMSDKQISASRIFLFEFVVLAAAVGVSEGFWRMGLFDQAADTSMITEVLYALFFVALLGERPERRAQISPGGTIKLFFSFSVVLISMSVIREFLAEGTAWGISVHAPFAGYFPYMAHDSSAAIMLSAVIIAMRLLMRRSKKDCLGLESANRDIENTRLPYLDVRAEQDAFLVSLILLGLTLLIGTTVFGSAYAISVSGLPVILTPLAAVVLQAIIMGIALSIKRKERNRFSETVKRPIIIPLQTAVLFAPIELIFERDIDVTGLLSHGLRYFVSLILLWLFVVGVTSFIKTFSRKMLFGRRPKSVEGLPFVLILTALTLIALTAFAGAFRAIV
ncbi:MAG: hypothetical protein JW780_01370 [Clostridiales bacterium]|nr:hypothetical protein [Clostridiales bacterium]